MNKHVEGGSVKWLESLRKFPKTKGSVPKKYVKGAKNPKAREKEIKRTAKLYKREKAYSSYDG